MPSLLEVRDYRRLGRRGLPESWVSIFAFVAFSGIFLKMLHCANPEQHYAPVARHATRAQRNRLGLANRAGLPAPGSVATLGFPDAGALAAAPARR
jgi:hypothetical protein